MTYLKNFLFLTSVGCVRSFKIFLMNYQKICFRVIVAISLLVSSATTYSQEGFERDNRAESRLGSWTNPLTNQLHIARPRIDSVKVNDQANIVNVYFPSTLSYYSFRENDIKLFYESLKKSLGWRYRKYSVVATSNGFALAQLVPNLYRTTLSPDSSRVIAARLQAPALVRKVDDYQPTAAINGKGIALWHSHGYFYEATLDRWEWQRAKLFGTVEDVSTMAYVLPYLTKMLENAGAITYIPRERDFRPEEVIVDNDRSTGNSEVVLQVGTLADTLAKGFLLRDTLFTGDNPFAMGTSLRIKGDTAWYIPDIASAGSYAVYISWPRRDDNSTSVLYNVNHTGGTTGFVVNQTIGGPTWTYLGTFHFAAGKDMALGSVSITDIGGEGRYTGLDAVKFGGGMGNVARRPFSETIPNQRSVEALVPAEQTTPTDVSLYSWKPSGKPRFIEGSRYYLQYAGMPDTLVYTPNRNRNDYNDDYQSRSLWVNYLIKPPGSDMARPAGLGIPIDLAFAFHTDAGITDDESIVGTLAIYSTGTGGGLFPDGSSRMASRELSELVQTQIVDDIRQQFNSDWTRRGTWDRPYYEARVPDVPTMLLELLSHQNQADQVFGLDPRFRFAVSRSIYKGMLRYFSHNDGTPYIVQPLPVKKFAITPVSGMRVRLSWEPQVDELEPTAMPTMYRVSVRTGNNGFDNGFLTTDTTVEIDIESYDTVYSFRITALNGGGESFGSEILAAGISSVATGNVLVVNGFNRVSGPSWFDHNGMAGVEWWNDRGVPWNYDISPIGDQYDFDRKSPWLDDDAPGWGATYSELEGMVVAGNSFDFTATHGSSILKAGHSFYSVSEEYFSSSTISGATYQTVDIIMGEQKTTPAFKDRNSKVYSIYTPRLIEKISEVTASGINIFMSGAYIGSDIGLSYSDSTAIKFAASVLGFKHRTSHSVNSGNVYSTDAVSRDFNWRYGFNTSFARDIYQVEAPDAIEPANRGAATAFRYLQNHTSAGVIYNAANYRVVTLGFPFETILSDEKRDDLMKQVLNYLQK